MLYYIFFICYCTIKDFSAGIYGVICTRKINIDRGVHYTIIDLCWGVHGVLLNSYCHIDRRGAEVNMIKLTVQ